MLVGSNRSPSVPYVLCSLHDVVHSQVTKDNATVYRPQSCLSNVVNALKAHSISVSAVDFEINDSFNLPSGDPLSSCGPLCVLLFRQHGWRRQSFPSKYVTAPANIPVWTNLSTLPFSVTVFAHSGEYLVIQSMNVELYATLIWYS